MENSMEFPQKKNLELPCDIAIPLLGMYLEKQKQKLKQKQNKTAQ